jgi:catechol 2,3-dioxygenase-like lactoylglutathione lyase family enzyme
MAGHAATPTPPREIRLTPNSGTLEPYPRSRIVESEHRDCPECPYLRVFKSTVYVRNHDTSLKFYIDQLGFSVVADARFDFDGRWVALAPPDGSAILALIAPKPGTENYKLIGRNTQVGFLSEDINATYELWHNRGVRFHHPPQQTLFGATVAGFYDIDGNSFELLGSGEITREIETQRRHAAERLESERRAAQELEIAKQVQARHVGGDYYDFLALGNQRLGLVIGDIAGKGIAAALLMANLQANLRSQYALARDEPQLFLQSVNRLFFQNTTDSAYATLFFADYDDAARCLRYANCGHLCAILLRRSGEIERLHATATVLGMFEEWHSPTVECQLAPGDIFALYTDGVTEAFNESEEEFGEARFIAALQRSSTLPPQAILSAVIDEIKLFSPHEQHDDITLIVAKCTPNQGQQ